MPHNSIITELSPSMPSQASAFWVPRVKKPIMSPTPRTAKYATNATSASRYKSPLTYWPLSICPVPIRHMEAYVSLPLLPKKFLNRAGMFLK